MIERIGTAALGFRPPCFQGVLRNLNTCGFSRNSRNPPLGKRQESRQGSVLVRQQGQRKPDPHPRTPDPPDIRRPSHVCRGFRFAGVVPRGCSSVVEVRSRQKIRVPDPARGGAFDPSRLFPRLLYRRAGIVIGWRQSDGGSPCCYVGKEAIAAKTKNRCLVINLISSLPDSELRLSA